MKNNKKTPSSDENWIKKQSKKSDHELALIKLAEVKQFESQHEFQTIRVDRKTVILKLIK